MPTTPQDLQTYVGLKIVNAKPMTRGEYNVFRGWQCPADENPADEGFLVEYIDGGQANTADYAWYVSWSPKDVFERAYRPTSGLTFGQALEAVKRGARAARAGWNGKGMFIYLHKGAFDRELSACCKEGLPPDCASTHDGIPSSLFERWQDGTVTRYPNIRMQAATGAVVEGWLASQTDMLAEDWTILD